jgi:uncharacterized OB-fold protein
MMVPLVEIPFKAAGALQGGRCKDCQALAFPPPPVCASCLSQAIEPYVLPNDGTLYSFTVVHRKDTGPLMVGYADLPDGLRVFGQIAPSSRPLIEGQVRITVNAEGPPHCLFIPTEA